MSEEAYLTTMVIACLAVAVGFALLQVHETRRGNRDPFAGFAAFLFAFLAVLHTIPWWT